MSLTLISLVFLPVKPVQRNVTCVDVFQAGPAEERSDGESDVQRSVWYSG